MPQFLTGERAEERLCWRRESKSYCDVQCMAWQWTTKERRVGYCSALPADYGEALDVIAAKLGAR